MTSAGATEDVPAEMPEDVAARYRALRDLVASIPARPSGDPDLAARVSPWIAREARLLDSCQFETWLDGFTHDAVVWVPIDSASDPGADQSLYLDDRRRLGERVEWRRDPSAWGQQPPSVCTRVLGGVEAWLEPDDRVVVRSAFTLVEQRHGREQLLAGHQVHELVGEPARCCTKVILVPRLATGVRNPSFLL